MVIPWKINEFIRYYSGEWYLITDEEELSVEKVGSIKPDFIFTHHRFCTNIVHQYCDDAAVVALFRVHLLQKTP